jgi:hypothetical protein
MPGAGRYRVGGIARVEGRAIRPGDRRRDVLPQSRNLKVMRASAPEPPEAFGVGDAERELRLLQAPTAASRRPDCAGPTASVRGDVADRLVRVALGQLCPGAEDEPGGEPGWPPRPRPDCSTCHASHGDNGTSRRNRRTSLSKSVRMVAWRCLLVAGGSIESPAGRLSRMATVDQTRGELRQDKECRTRSPVRLSSGAEIPAQLVQGPWRVVARQAGDSLPPGIDHG